MTTTFNVNSTLFEIKMALMNFVRNNIDNNVLTVDFDNGMHETLVFDPKTETPEAAATRIATIVDETSREIHEMLASDDDMSDEDLESMYQAMCDEQDGRYDAEDAILHHYCNF